MFVCTPHAVHDQFKLNSSLPAPGAGAIRRAKLAELVMAVHMSQACNSTVKEQALNVLAGKLAAAPHAAALARQQAVLAALDSVTLAHLLRRTLRAVAAQGSLCQLRSFDPAAQAAAGDAELARAKAGQAMHAAVGKIARRNRRTPRWKPEQPL